MVENTKAFQEIAKLKASAIELQSATKTPKQQESMETLKLYLRTIEESFHETSPTTLQDQSSKPQSPIEGDPEMGGEISLVND